MLKFKLMILLLFITTAIGYTQNSNIKHYTIDDGLPSNNVFTIYFDSKGYLWIGTNKGIGRYNGLEFKTFTTNDGLPDNEIFSFFEDVEGRLWISNFKGSLCYFKDNVFHTPANTPWLRLNEKTPSNYFEPFQLLSDSSIVTESVDVKSLIIIKGNTIKTIPIDKLAVNFKNYDDARPISIKRSGDKLMLSYQYKSLLIDEKANIIKSFYYKDNKPHHKVFSSRQSFIAVSDALYNDAEKVIGIPPQVGKTDDPSTLAWHIDIQDRNSIFWASKYGLFYNGSLQLLNEHLTSIDHDLWGNVWVGSINKGIYCLSKDFNDSYEYQGTIGDIAASRIIGNQIHLITETGDVYNLFNNLNSAAPIQKTGLGNQLIKKYNTYITPSGNILNLQLSKLYYKDKAQHKFKETNVILNNKVDFRPTYKCVNYIDSTFYASTIGSIIKIKSSDLSGNGSLKFNDLTSFTQSLYDRIYYSSINRADTSIWFSKNHKMFRMKNRSIREENGLKNITFRQFDFFKNYLVGISDNYKLYIYNAASKTIDSVTNSNCIWETLYDINDSTVVINTNNSYKLLKLYPPSKNGKPAYSMLTVENGFLPKHADYIFGDGKYYYFLKNGILSGFPDKMISRKAIPPRPIFVSVETNKTSHPLKEKIDISYNESHAITVKIDNISFNDKNVINQYSISKNETDNWSTITGNEINLNNIGIGYGKYIIKLRSKTGASDFSKPAVLILQIATPFWAQWWFIGLCIVAFILLVLMIIRLIIWRQVRKQQKEFDAEMKYQQSEYKALNALMNPHFIFNSLNNIQGLINKDHKETANQYLVIFSKLIRQNMLNISKGYISLYQEMILIENYLYLEKLRFKELINFTINIDADIDTETIMIPPLLIQPLVENAIIHGLLPMQSEDSKLSIRIYEMAEVIHIEIEDNGVGLNQSLKKKTGESDSYGLSNLHRRIEHVKKFQQGNIEFEIKELLDESGKTLGTKASVTIEQL